MSEGPGREPRLDELAAALETERQRCRRAEETLRQVEERHHLLIDGVKDYAIFALDSEGRVTTWNEGARRMFGYEDREILGRHVAITFTEEDRRADRPRRELHEARDRGSAVDENWAVRKDGSLFWASGMTTGLRDEAGGLSGFVKIARDLTQRRQAEEALRQSEARLRAALSAARMGTWLWDIPADRDWLDHNLLRLLGLPPGTPVNTLEDFLVRIHPEDRAAVSEAFRRSARDGTRLSLEFRVVWPDGTVRWLRDEGDVLRDPEGRPRFLAGACVDVTERRQTEQELEARVQERTAELRQAQHRALQAERLAAIGQMVTGLAHESRNVIQRGQAYLERLRWRLTGQPEALALLAEAQKAQDDLLRLYEDVRGYAVPIALDYRPCDLADVWRAAWSRLAPARAGRDARLREEPGDCGTMCEADPFRMEQVFRNFFDNSLAACADPVVVTVTCRATELAGRPALHVAVLDNGPGLTAEQRQRVFEPFYTTKVHGTGLGTPIARRIVEAHGGHVAVGEGPDPGAEFILTLPRSRV